jgi:hypothetical protein
LEWEGKTFTSWAEFTGGGVIIEFSDAAGKRWRRDMRGKRATATTPVRLPAQRRRQENVPAFIADVFDESLADIPEIVHYRQVRPGKRPMPGEFAVRLHGRTVQ